MPHVLDIAYQPILTLDETLSEQEGEFDADTGWVPVWFEQFGI